MELLAPKGSPALLGAVLLAVACGGPTDSTPEGTDDTQHATDTPEDPDDGVCGPGEEGCSCVSAPEDPEMACWHTYGGRYGPGGCSGSYQCCEGTWGPKQTCGTCTCTEVTGQQGCVPEVAARLDCFAEFTATIEPLSEALKAAMTGKSWHEGCPVGLDQLSLVTVAHWGFDGEVHQGRLVVATAVATEVRDVFEHAYLWRFPVERMEPVYLYDGSDDASMAANNTSAFNCRPVTGGSSWSKHSYGDAIDINPVQNPYVKGEVVLPPAGADYLDRTTERQGVILSPGPMAGPFLGRGWDWGGQWSSFKDYQHFSKSGG